MLSKKKVLIIADNYREYISALSAITEIPQKFYYTNLESFEKMTTIGLYDLILLDCDLTIDKGIHAVRKIKETTPQNLVLLIGDCDSAENIVNAFRSGVRDYIKKPLDLDLLRKAVVALYRIRNGLSEKRSAVFMPAMIPLAGQPRDITTEMMQSVLRYIESNLGSDIYLEELAQIVNLSKFHFIRKFKQHSGHTPKQYIILKRIEKAKEMLKSDAMLISISELSTTLGFNYISDFCYHFKKKTGLTPSHYRRSKNIAKSKT